MTLADWFNCQYDPQSVPHDTQRNILGVASGPKREKKISGKKDGKEEVPPFNATVFFRTDWMAWSGITVLPPFSTGVTLTSSHWMGTYKPTISGEHPSCNMLYFGSIVDGLDRFTDLGADS